MQGVGCLHQGAKCCYEGEGRDVAGGAPAPAQEMETHRSASCVPTWNPMASMVRRPSSPRAWYVRTSSMRRNSSAASDTAGREVDIRSGKLARAVCDYDWRKGGSRSQHLPCLPQA